MEIAKINSYAPPAIEPLSSLYETKKVNTPSYRDTISSTQASIDPIRNKPTLDPHWSPSAVALPILCAKLMDRIQSQILTSEEPAVLKSEHLGKKMADAQETLRKEQIKLLNTDERKKTWAYRQQIANFLFYGTHILAGGGLCASGQLIAGGSLIVSGTGNISSGILRYYGFDPTWTGALAMTSSAIGLVGSLGSGAYQVFSNPQNLMHSLNHPTFQGFLQTGVAATGLIASGVQGISSIEKHKAEASIGQIQALQTKTETFLKTTEQKHSSALSSFSSTANSFANLFKGINRSHSRFVRDAMRVLTAEYPA